MAISTSTKFHGNDGVDGDQVLNYLESHHEVRELRCEEIVTDQHVHAMDRLLKKCHSAIHLNSLELPHNGLTAAAGEPLANILAAQYETLKKLGLSHNPITAAGLTHLLNPLKQDNPPSRLVSLDLTKTKLGVNGAKEIAEMLRYNGSLQELYLGTNNFGPRGMKALAPALESNSSLQVLDLSDNNIRIGACSLAQALQNSTESNLRILDISSNRIGASSMQKFANLLIEDRRIEGFYVGRNELGPEGAFHLGNVLKHNYTLRDLRLEGNEIGDAGALLIAEGLTENEISANNTTLERLDLGWNGIERDGATGLAEALRENNKLTHVNLTGNRIGSEGAQALAEALPYNLTLHELILTNNHIENSGAFALAMAWGRPTCRLKKLHWEENPIMDEGLASLDRVPTLRRNHEYWLGQLLRNLSRGIIASVNLTDRSRCIGDEEVLLLTDTLAEYHPLVRMLWLDGSTLSSRSIVPLIERALPPPSNTIRFYLTDFECGDDIAMALSQALRRNSTLEVLCLKNCSITQHGATAIADGLRNNSALRRLNLDRNHIGDDGMVALSKALPHTSLTSISASKNQLTDKSMSLESLRTLEELHMDGNQITDRGALEFCRFLMGENGELVGCRLERISLRQNKVTGIGGGIIKQCLPETADVQF
jgi:Ran GTPase-activating protein (RanGAP) involved in mRNA processing and transport